MNDNKPEVSVELFGSRQGREGPVISLYQGPYGQCEIPELIAALEPASQQFKEWCRNADRELAKVNEPEPGLIRTVR